MIGSMQTAPVRRRDDGFVERGAEVTRIEAFVDASFAFAVTLLVISLDKIPTNAPELIAALKRIPAFAASFTLVCMFWHQHTVWSRRFGLEDRRSNLLSLLLVFLVLIYVFPLRVLFSGFFHWVTRGLLPSEFRIDSLSTLQLTFIVYGVAFGTLGLVIVALNAHALSRREHIGLDAYEVLETRREVAGWMMAPVTALISVTVAACVRPSWHPALFGLPGVVYCLMGLTGIVAHRAVPGPRRRPEG
jgi:uncharacterized membrane protein